MRWKCKCEKFRKVRQMIFDDIETTQHCINILSTLLECCREISNNKAMISWKDEFDAMEDEINDGLYEVSDDFDHETNLETVNYILGDFYDLCDSAGVWLVV